MRTSSGYGRKTFAVPVTSGQFAPETLVLAQHGAGTVDKICRLRVLVEALPTAATIEVEVLAAGQDAGVDANWKGASQSLNAVGLGALLELASWPGVRLRAKSGGTAGDATASASWE